MEKTLVILLMVGVVSAIEMMKDGSFPIGSDYEKEKEKQGADPVTYKKTYHRKIPGGQEHAEVMAANGPGSNSWSQTYSKHQSFGSADTVQSQSYSSSNHPAPRPPKPVLVKHSVQIPKRAKEEAMARHNEIMQSMQQNMGMGGFGMQQPIGMQPFGYEPKMPSSSVFDEMDKYMKSHMRMMNEIIRLQNAQFQSLQKLIGARFPEEKLSKEVSGEVKKDRDEKKDTD